MSSNTPRLKKQKKVSFKQVLFEEFKKAFDLNNTGNIPEVSSLEYKPAKKRPAKNLTQIGQTLEFTDEYCKENKEIWLHYANRLGWMAAEKLEGCGYIVHLQFVIYVSRHPIVSNYMRWVAIVRYPAEKEKEK